MARVRAETAKKRTSSWLQRKKLQKNATSRRKVKLIEQHRSFVSKVYKDTGDTYPKSTLSYHYCVMEALINYGQWHPETRFQIRALLDREDHAFLAVLRDMVDPALVEAGHISGE